MRTTISYRVPYADTDQMSVVYYGNYYTYFERCRNEFLRELDLPYKTLEAQGIMLPVTQSHCNYHLPAKYDDLLEISAEVIEVSKVSLKIACEVHRDGQLLASGYTVHVCMNATSRKIARFPEIILKKFMTKE
ncbi:MAG: acyl-CoA thioesterase [Lentisphaeria bacterium]